VLDHPQYAMWKARFDIEQAAARQREARRAKRDAEQVEWNRAWPPREAPAMTG
jgi:hypothetical protein